MPKKELIFYVNGQWYPRTQARISVLDVGLGYGDGVFEGIRVYDGKIFKLREHLDRLFKSMRVIQIEPPLTRDDLTRLSIEFVRRNTLVDGHFKIVVTRGEGYGSLGRSQSQPSVMILGMPIQGLYPEKSKEGIRLKTSSLRKPPPECLDPRIKTLNYMNSILNRLDAFASGVDDSLILDLHGFVAECPSANFFIANGAVIETPTRQNVLEGITRKTVIELARTAGYLVLEEDITLYDVYTAEEAFVCGSLAGVISVTEVDGRKIGRIGPVTRKLQQLYHELTHKDGPWLTKAL